MDIPRLSHPQCYQGLYLFDFGDHVSVGYTAEEIEILLSHPEHCNGRAYRIHQASAAGELALRGLSGMDTQAREALLFFRSTPQAARRDFETLKQAALSSAPPTVLRWHLARDPALPLPEFTALIYAAVCSERVGRWLQNICFEGGDQVEGGARLAGDFEQSDCTRLEEVAIAPDRRFHSRPAEVLLRDIHLPVQRDLC